MHTILCISKKEYITNNATILLQTKLCSIWLRCMLLIGQEQWILLTVISIIGVIIQFNL